MPKETHYLKQYPHKIQIRRLADDGIAFSYQNNILGRMKAFTKCWRLNNLTDDVTMNVYNHMVRIGKDYKIPDDFLPSSFPVSNRLVIVNSNGRNSNGKT